LAHLSSITCVDAFEALERHLSRNRKITVYHGQEKRCSDGPKLTKLYALNSFYNGSAALVEKSSIASRPPLVTTALLESASKNFQYAALLLSNHTDVLCEFVSCSVEAHDGSARCQESLSQGDMSLFLPTIFTPY
jgi:hypothetical protein